jgi:hypothetical protein
MRSDLPITIEVYRTIGLSRVLLRRVRMIAMNFNAAESQARLALDALRAKRADTAIVLNARNEQIYALFGSPASSQVPASRPSTLADAISLGRHLRSVALD